MAFFLNLVVLFTSIYKYKYLLTIAHKNITWPTGKDTVNRWKQYIYLRTTVTCVRDGHANMVAVLVTHSNFGKANHGSLILNALFG